MARKTTSQKKAEESLRLQTDRFQHIIDHSQDFIFEIDLTGRFIMANPTADRLLGISPEQLLTQSVHDLVTPEYKQVLTERLRRISASLPVEQPFYLEVFHKDGRRISLELVTSVVHHDRNIVGIQGIARDITERRKAEEAIRKSELSERQLRKQLTILNEVTAELSKASSLDDLCRRAVELGRKELGFDRLGIWFIEEKPDRLRGSFGTDEEGNTRDERHMTSRIEKDFIASNVIGEPKRRIALRHNQYLNDEQGNRLGPLTHVVAALWNGEDIIGCLSADNLFSRRPFTVADCELLKLFASSLGHLCSQKRTEEALRISESRYRAIVEDQTELICRHLPDGTITFANQALCDYLHKTSRELIGTTFLPLLLEEHRLNASRYLESLSRAKPVQTVEFRVMIEGQIRWNQWTTRKLFDDHGNFIEYQASGRDITEQKLASQALEHLHLQLIKAREEERRHLARDLHDSLGQRIIAMHYSLQNAISQLEHPPASFQVITQGCSDMIREIRNLSHGLYPATLESLGLPAGLNQIANSCLANVKFHVETSPQAQQGRFGDDIEIAFFRIAQEAVNNALRHSHAKNIRLKLSLQDQKLTLVVEDDGCGFDIPAAANKGMGLSTMKERAKAIGGELEIASQAGQTRIIVRASVR